MLGSFENSKDKIRKNYEEANKHEANINRIGNVYEVSVDSNYIKSNNVLYILKKAPINTFIRYSEYLDCEVFLYSYSFVIPDIKLNIDCPPNLIFYNQPPVALIFNYAYTNKIDNNIKICGNLYMEQSTEAAITPTPLVDLFFNIRIASNIHGGF